MEVNCLFTFRLPPPLKRIDIICLKYKEKSTVVMNKLLPHFLLLFFFSFSFQYLVNLTAMIFCIGLLGFIVLFKKSRRTLPDHKPWQEIFSDDVLFVFVFAFCFMFYVLSRFCISAMHTASLWSNNRESDIVFTYTNFILLNE